MFGATVIAAVAALRSLSQLKRQSDHANRNVIAAVANARAAEANAEAADNALRTTQEIERAYITLECAEVHFAFASRTAQARKSSDADAIETLIKLKNVGRTPGSVLGGWCGLIHQSRYKALELLPTMDSSTRLTPIFLLPSDAKDFSLRIELGKIQTLYLRHGEPTRTQGPIENVPVMEPTNALWLIGEVDYCDRFGGQHRAGYGTRWSYLAGRFLWDPSVSDRNYDRPMTEQERKLYEQN